MTIRDKFKNRLFGFPMLKQMLDMDFESIIKYLDFVYENIENEQNEIDKLTDGLTTFENEFDEERFDSFIADKSYYFDSVFPNELNKGIFLSIFGTFEFRIRIAHKLVYQIVKREKYSDTKFLDIWTVKQNMLDLLDCSNDELKESWKSINHLKEIRNSIAHNNSMTNIALKNSEFKLVKDLILSEYSEYLTIENGFFKIERKDFHYFAIAKFKDFFKKLDIEVKNYAT
jgi:hypothetical protein